MRSTGYRVICAATPLCVGKFRLRCLPDCCQQNLSTVHRGNSFKFINFLIPRVVSEDLSAENPLQNEVHRTDARLAAPMAAKIAL